MSELSRSVFASLMSREATGSRMIEAICAGEIGGGWLVGFFGVGSGVMFVLAGNLGVDFGAAFVSAGDWLTFESAGLGAVLLFSLDDGAVIGEGVGCKAACSSGVCEFRTNTQVPPNATSSNAANANCHANGRGLKKSASDCHDD